MSRFPTLPAVIGLACLACCALGFRLFPDGHAARLTPAGALDVVAAAPLRTAPKARASLARPFSFESNRGQTLETVDFLARGKGYQLFLSPAEATLALRAPDSPDASLRMKLLEADAAAQPDAREELPGKVNYFLGDDASRWRTGIPTYARVRYESVWPGVSVEYYGNEGELEFDFVVAPGADPSAIAMEIEGAERLELDDAGELRAHVGGGAVILRKPVIYQEIDGQLRPIAGAFVLRGERQVAFQLESYDRALALVIDPVMVYSTYWGGGTSTVQSQDEALAVDMDVSGNAYVTGYTLNSDFPTTAGALDLSLGGTEDIFVTKFNPAGGVVYSTYLGGSLTERANAIAVDALGNAYVTGFTLSTNFPVASPFQATKRLGSDAFVTKLNATGSALAYSTYLGGNDDDLGNGIQVNSLGQAYITGSAEGGTSSPPIAFPTTTGAYDQTPNNPTGVRDAFFSKLSASGNSLVYSTLLGGGSHDVGNAISIDSAGRACIAGETFSAANIQANFPTTPGAFQGPPAISPTTGHNDGFMAIINPAGAGAAGLVYSTYLRGTSGTGQDEAHGIGLDAAGKIYVGGKTNSVSFPTTPGAYDRIHGGGGFGHDVFVAKLNPAGAGATDLIFSTYIGGPGNDADPDFDMAMDSAGNVFLVGSSSNWPTINALQPASAGGSDGFLTWLKPDGSALLYSSYLGGSNSERAYGVALHGSGAVVVVGWTTSTNFPIKDAVQPTKRALGDAFVTRFEGFDLNDPPTTTCPMPVSRNCTPPGGIEVTVGAHVTDADGDALTVTWSVNSVIVETDNVPAGGPPTSADVTLVRNYPPGTYTVQITVNDGHGGVVGCGATVMTVGDTQAPTISCAVELTAPADASCQAAVPDFTATDEFTATDDCTPNGLTLTQDPPVGALHGLGTHVVTVTATDGSGNASTCTTQFTVLDETPPTITQCATHPALIADADCMALVPDLTAGVTATDNCSASAALVVNQSPAAGGSVGLGESAILLTVTDEVGHESTCTAALTVQDTTPPVITLVGESESILECHVDAYAEAGANVLDACDPERSLTASVSGAVDADAPGTYVVTYHATDASGNVAESITRTITVHDTTSASLTACPADVMVDTPSGDCAAVAEWTPPVASDLCAVATLTSSHLPGDSFPVGATLVTYTASDGANPSVSCTFNVVVTDIQDPSIHDVPENISVVNDPGQCSATVAWTPPDVSDNCPGATLDSDYLPGDGFPVGATTVLYSAGDAQGRTATAGFTVTVTDNEPPALLDCPGDLTFPAAPAQASATISWSAPGGTDNCAGVVVEQTGGPSPGSEQFLGTYGVTYAARDAAGNSATCTFNVRVIDDQPPMIADCPGNIEEEAQTGECFATISWTPPTASDNAPNVIVLHVEGPAPGSPFQAGTTTTVGYAANDAAGNAAACSFTVTVLDAEAPTIPDCPANVTVSTDATSCTATAAWTHPGCSDNCAGCNVSQTLGPESGSIFPLGVSTLQYTATDASGRNTADCAFTVTVVDDRPPAFSGCPGDMIQNAAPGSCAASVSWTPPTADDNCALTDVSANHTPGESFPVGMTPVTYLATDPAGGAGSCAFNVTVIDSQPPSITALPSNPVLQADSSCQAALPNLAAETTADDNCAVASIAQAPPAGTPLGLGAASATLLATDGAGLTASATANLTVVDGSTPVISQCAGNVTVNAGGSGQAAAPELSAQIAVSDNCDSNLSIMQSPAAGTMLGAGTTTVTFTVSDDAGNTATCQSTVTVSNCPPPQATCSVATSLLWPPNHNLINVGLAASGSDACGSSPTLGVTVYSDEDDEEPTGDGNHSPDAKNAAAGSLRLRAERKGNADGRVYLIVTRATASGGQVGTQCCTVVVPHSQNSSSVNAVRAQATAAESYWRTHAAPPPGFVVVGDGPVIGPKQ